MHEGPIHEFPLYVEADAHCDEIAHILSQVAQRNTVKKIRPRLVHYDESLFNAGFACETISRPTSSVISYRLMRSSDTQKDWRMN
nr:hypothetical protein [Tanacetum cinerariifolium]